MLPRGLANPFSRPRSARRSYWQVTLLCQFVVIAPMATARTWVVDQQGSGDFTAIQDAANATADGDTILLFPGRYDEYRPYDFGALTESTCVVIERSNITLRGVDRDAVIIGPELYRWTDPREPNGIAMSGTASTLRIENLTAENLVNAIENFSSGFVSNVSIRNCREAIVARPLEVVLYDRLLIEESRRYGMSSWNQGGGALYRDCTFRGDKTDVLISGEGKAELVDCTFESGAWLQVQSYSTSLLDSCRFFGGGSVIVIGRGVARLVNSVLGASSTVALQILTSSSATATGCRLSGGALGTILVHGDSNAQLDSCQVLNLSGPTVEVNHTTAHSNTVDLRNNWWGTTDPSQIEQWILDGHDDPDRGAVVLFEPFLTQGVAAQRTSIGKLKSLFHNPN